MVSSSSVPRADIAGASPNWGASLSGKLHARLPFPDAFQGGFAAYYGTSHLDVMPSSTSSSRGSSGSGRRHFRDAEGGGRSQREPALFWEDVNAQGIAAYFARDAKAVNVAATSSGAAPAFRRHVREVSPHTRRQRAEGRMFLTQPLPASTRPSRRRLMPEPCSSSEELGKRSGRKCFFIPPSFGAKKDGDTQSARTGGGGRAKVRARGKNLEEGVFAGRKSDTELIRVEDENRYELSVTTR